MIGGMLPFAVRQMAALGRPGNHPPGRQWNYDRAYEARVVVIHSGKPMVDVFCPDLNSLVRNVRVKQAAPSNMEASCEIIPGEGDLGIIKFLNGNKNKPYWDGWLPLTDQPTYRGDGKLYRILHKSGVLVEFLDGNIRLKTKVDTQTGEQDEDKGTYLYLKDDDSIVIHSAPGGVAISGDKRITLRSKEEISADVETGKHIFLGTSSDDGGIALVKKSWMDAMEAHIASLETQVKLMATSLNAAGVDPVLVGLAQTAAASLASAGTAGQAIVAIGIDPAYKSAKTTGATTKTRAD